VLQQHAHLCTTASWSRHLHLRVVQILVFCCAHAAQMRRHLEAGPWLRLRSCKVGDLIRSSFTPHQCVPAAVELPHICETAALSVKLLAQAVSMPRVLRPAGERAGVDKLRLSGRGAATDRPEAPHQERLRAGAPPVTLCLSRASRRGTCAEAYVHIFLQRHAPPL